MHRVAAHGLVLATVVVLAGCQSFAGRSAATGSIGPSAVAADSRTYGQGISLGPASAGIGVTTTTVAVGPAEPLQPVGLPPPAVLSPPPPPPDLVGGWRIARAGDAGCRLELSERRIDGDLPARTRGCRDVGLSRVGSWMPTPGGLVLLDHERRQLALLRAEGPRFYAGTTGEGAGLTLWR